MKAVVLCGGLGTRLGELTRYTPKPMLTVAGRPFIAHVLDHLVIHGVDGLVLAVSFEWEKLRSFVGDAWRGVPVAYSVEKMPLGTGGGIAHAMRQENLTNAVVVNWDTLIMEDPRKLQACVQDGDELALTVVHVDQANRYGTVAIDLAGKLAGFSEKGVNKSGWVNAGMYSISRNVFDDMKSQAFSFEHDILAQRRCMDTTRIYKSSAYFIDMGVPEDLERADREIRERLGKLA
jgi:D-glycero-alpha-D-manno-heptose 1-phosphate guanylyltransferase